MLGLVSSLVLRCDDCITYHVVRCHEEGTTREEFLEIFSVGLVVGGSIVIPHLRRAMARLEELAPGAEVSLPSGRRGGCRTGRRDTSTPAMIIAPPARCSNPGRSPSTTIAVSVATRGVSVVKSAARLGPICRTPRFHSTYATTSDSSVA